MNKKWLLGAILVLTVLAITLVVVLTSSTRYSKLIISEEQWNSIINNRKLNEKLNLNKIEFNDYNLMLDNENDVIYYSIVDSSNKYDPSVKYSANESVKIAINTSITDEKIEKDNALKVLIYTDKEYRIYTLVATNFPILNIKYKDDEKDSIDLEIFDNHVDSPQRVLKSTGKFKVIEENEEYSFSLKKESIGRNTRDNYISIFGMEKRDKYVIKKVDNTDRDEKYVRLFIDNKYNGLYSFGPKNLRRDDIFDRNRENNR